MGVGDPDGSRGSEYRIVWEGNEALILSANLIWTVYENGGASVSDPLKISGKLYEYGGFVHFICESSDMRDISPDDPLPLTFVPHTAGSADPPAVVVEHAVDGEWYHSFSDERRALL